jgi:dihydrofolate reductase
LKRQVSGDIVVYGSGQLARALIGHDLADELRLIVCPFALGAGEGLFGEISDSKPLSLVGARSVGDSLVYLTYRARR